MTVYDNIKYILALYYLLLNSVFMEECTIINCQCCCHKLYPQQINIKEMLMDQFKDDASSASGYMLFNDDENEEIVDKCGLMSDSDALWERRRKLHSGEIKPHSHEDFKHHFKPLEVLKAECPDIEEDSTSVRRSKSPKKSQSITTQNTGKQTNAKLMQNEQTRLTRKTEVNNERNRNIADPQISRDDYKDNANIGQSRSEQPDTVEPVALNPLHKYKINERDIIIRDIYTQAVRSMKCIYPNMDATSDEFRSYVNSEADRLLRVWMEKEERKN